MATKARQQYFADEDSLQKIRREFSIADEIQQKIDSVEEGAQVNKIETIKVNGTALVPDAYKAVDIDVPEVIDNLYTVDSDNALSAKQGKLLYDYIQNIASRGRFLSNWNSATGLPMTNPSESSYPYKSGDYFIVSNVAGLGGTNYRPDGSSYIIGQASTVVETESVDVSDFYFYDGTTWLLLKNSSRSGAADSSLSTTSTNPVENRVITNALNGKQDTLIAGTNIQIAADGKTISATNINTKTFFPSGINDTATLQEIVDWRAEGNNPLIAFSYFPDTGVIGYNIFKLVNKRESNGNFSLTFDKVSYGNDEISRNTFQIEGTVSNSVYTAVEGSTETYSSDWLSTDNETVYTPTGNYNPATKKYVDDQVSAATAGAVSDTAYGTSWNGVTGIAPSKNAVYDKISAMDTTIAGKQNTLTEGTGISIDSNDVISNTGVTSFNGNTGAVTYTAPVSSVNNQTGAVTVLESQTKVFPMPEVGDDISDIISWITAGKEAVLIKHPDSETYEYYRVYLRYTDTKDILCEKVNIEAGTVTGIWITYSNANIVETAGPLTRLIAPSGGTAGQVLTQNGNGRPTWQTSSGGSSTITVTLASASWSSKSITVSATGVTASNTVIVSPDPSDYSDYTDAEIYCSAQGTNSLTFVCGTTPSNDIDVNVIIIS